MVPLFCVFGCVRQLLCALPEVGQRYDGAGTEVFKTAPEEVASDFPAQVCGEVEVSRSRWPPSCLGAAVSDSAVMRCKL